MAASASPQVSSQETMTKTSQRLVFLDVVRGMTVAFMILVNNHGNEKATSWPLENSNWNASPPTH
jgi:predicted acyltransferase